MPEAYSLFITRSYKMLIKSFQHREKNMSLSVNDKWDLL